MANSLAIKIIVVTCGALSAAQAEALGAKLILPSLAQIPDFLEARGVLLGQPLTP